MKKYTIILLLLFSSFGFSQLGKMKHADKLYNKFAFKKAIQEYEAIYAKRPDNLHLNKQLADGYMMLRQPKKAIPYYKFVVKNKDVDPKYYLMYAQALKGDGKYKEAKKWMRKYKKSGLYDSRVEKFLKEPDYVDYLYNIKKRFTIKNSSLNTKNSDYGAIWFKNDVYFVSARNDAGKKKKKIYEWNEQPFLDIYKFSGDTKLITRLSDTINTKLHEGAVCFSPDGKTMYFTRSNYYLNKEKRDKNGTNNLKIFKTVFKNGKWSIPKPLFFSSDSYSVGHPSMSSDGKKLFFTSDMPGGFGGTDIYMCEVYDRGGLKKPMNLGSEINTEGNEMFPYFHLTENKLYFSSDGIPGFGLLDIFSAEFDGKENYKNITNLGEPINSSADDFAFYIEKKGKRGFISSNRKTEDSKGDDDIYEFIRERDFLLKGVVRDIITEEPINEAKLILSNEKGETVFELLTNTDGYYEYIIDRNKTYQLNIDKPKYENKIVTFNSFDKDDVAEMVVNVDLEPIRDMNVLAGVGINTIYFDFNRATIRRDAEYELNKILAVMHKYPQMVIRIESHTDSRGSKKYNRDLSHRRARSTYNYFINKGISPKRISSYKGYGEDRLVNNCADGVDCTEEEHQKNRRTDFVIEKFK